MLVHNIFNDIRVFKHVEIVYVTPKESRMLVIIVKINKDTYQDFYYNENEGLLRFLRSMVFVQKNLKKTFAF